MERRKQGNGWETFFEHWGFTFIALIAVAAGETLNFFFNLSGKLWIYFLAVGFVLLFTGSTLILYAKLPLYRSGRFFTFGIKSVPDHLAGFYRWGWSVFLFGVVLSLCLLLSR